MWIKKLTLSNFRNYESVNLDFEKGINFIEGSNGAGKTSLAEAIGFLALCKSIRTSDEKEVIKIGSDFTRIDALVMKNDHEEKYKMVISKEKKYIENNDNEVKKLTDIVGITKIVSFLPKDSDLMKEVPARRRRFLDVNISVVDRAYIYVLGEYNHLLEEMKNLIKQDSVDETTLKVLCDEISKRGVIIYQKRKNFIREINKELLSVGKYLMGEDSYLNVNYHPDIDTDNAEKYSTALLYRITSWMKDRFSQRSVIKGIHQDDFTLSLNSKDLGVYGSQGQNRMSIIALKLSLFSLVKKNYGEEPIVILDDVLSELDDNHQEKLVKLLNHIEQVFITGTKSPFREKVHLYTVEDNKTRRMF